MIKPEIALKYAKGIKNYCNNFVSCKDGCIFNTSYGCIFNDENPTDWDLEDVNYESNRDKDKT